MSVVGDRPPYYLGIDLGGTNIKSGVVDDDGRALSSIHLKTLADLGPEVGLDRLVEAAGRAVAASGRSWSEIESVGLGSPGTLDLESGHLIDPPNLPGWVDFPIRSRLGDRLKKETILQNDGSAAAYGEYWAGAGRGSRSLVLFTLGTGIGGGIVDRGRIVEGVHSHGAECGHIIIQMEGARRCTCGGYGHLEAYASATALVKRAREALAVDAASSLHRLDDDGTLTSRTIAEAAAAGDPLAARLIRETAHYLAVGAVSLMHTIDPDVVLFGGGMIAIGPEFLEMIRREVRERAFPILASRTRVEYAALGGDAGFIGAAGCARLATGASRLTKPAD